jgi:hypothetical protein
MTRVLNKEEQLRYPWASRTTDYVAVGALRKIGLLSAWLGMLGTFLIWLVVYITASRKVSGAPINYNTLERALFGVCAVAALAGALIGLITLYEAIVKNAKSPLVWSLGSLVPGAFWLYTLLH